MESSRGRREWRRGRTSRRTWRTWPRAAAPLRRARSTTRSYPGVSPFAFEELLLPESKILTRGWALECKTTVQKVTVPAAELYQRTAEVHARRCTSHSSLCMMQQFEALERCFVCLASAEPWEQPVLSSTHHCLHNIVCQCTHCACTSTAALFQNSVRGPKRWGVVTDRTVEHTGQKCVGPRSHP